MSHAQCIWLDRIPVPPPHSTPSLLYPLNASILRNPQHGVPFGRLAEQSPITDIVGSHLGGQTSLWTPLTRKFDRDCVPRNTRRRAKAKFKVPNLLLRCYEAVMVLVSIMMSVGWSSQGKPLKLRHRDISGAHCQGTAQRLTCLSSGTVTTLCQTTLDSITSTHYSNPNTQRKTLEHVDLKIRMRQFFRWTVWSETGQNKLDSSGTLQESTRREDKPPQTHTLYCVWSRQCMTTILNFMFFFETETSSRVFVDDWFVLKTQSSGKFDQHITCVIAFVKFTCREFVLVVSLSFTRTGLCCGVVLFRVCVLRMEVCPWASQVCSVVCLTLSSWLLVLVVSFCVLDPFECDFVHAAVVCGRLLLRYHIFSSTLVDACRLCVHVCVGVLGFGHCWSSYVFAILFRLLFRHVFAWLCVFLFRHLFRVIFVRIFSVILFLVGFFPSFLAVISTSFLVRDVFGSFFSSWLFVVFCVVNVLGSKEEPGASGYFNIEHLFHVMM